MQTQSKFSTFNEQRQVELHDYKQDPASSAIQYQEVPPDFKNYLFAFGISLYTYIWVLLTYLIIKLTFVWLPEIGTWWAFLLDYAGFFVALGLIIGLFSLLITLPYEMICELYKGKSKDEFYRQFEQHRNNQSLIFYVSCFRYKKQLWWQSRQQSYRHIMELTPSSIQDVSGNTLPVESIFHNWPFEAEFKSQLIFSDQQTEMKLSQIKQNILQKFSNQDDFQQIKIQGILVYKSHRYNFGQSKLLKLYSVLIWVCFLLVFAILIALFSFECFKKRYRFTLKKLIKLKINQQYKIRKRV